MLIQGQRWKLLQSPDYPPGMYFFYACGENWAFSQTFFFFFHAHQTWCNERLTSNSTCPGGGGSGYSVFLNQPLLRLRIANLLSVFGEDPDADVISPSQFAGDTMQTVFRQICGTDFALLLGGGGITIRSLAGANVRTRWLCVYVIWEWDGLEFKCAITRPHNNPPTSSHPAAPVGVQRPADVGSVPSAVGFCFTGFFVLPPVSVWVRHASSKWKRSCTSVPVGLRRNLLLRLDSSANQQATAHFISAISLRYRKIRFYLQRAEGKRGCFILKGNFSHLFELILLSVKSARCRARRLACCVTPANSILLMVHFRRLLRKHKQDCGSTIETRFHMEIIAFFPHSFLYFLL